MTLSEQFITLIIMIVSSFIIGIIFDGYRVFFNKLNISKLLFFIFDVCFGVLSAIFIFQLLLWSNNGQLRLVILIAFFIGLLLYYLILSKIFIVFWVFYFNIVYKVMKVLSQVIGNLILKPMKVMFYLIVGIFVVIRCYFYQIDIYL